MITSPISLAPLRVKKLTCQRAGPFRYASAKEPGFLAVSALIFGSACAIASTRSAESLRPTGGMFDARTGTGSSEVVVSEVVALAVVAGVVAVAGAFVAACAGAAGNAKAGAGQRGPELKGAPAEGNGEVRRQTGIAGLANPD